MLLFYMSSSHAENLNIYLLGGADFSKLHNEPSVRLDEFVVNNYNTQKTTVWDPVVGAGMTYSLRNVSTGLMLYWMNLGKVRGIEHPFANSNPNNDTLNYQFDVSSYLVMVESRFFYPCSQWQPYLLAGFGGTWNRLSSYNEVSTNPSSSATPTPIFFSSSTHNYYAYELGLGVQFPFYNDMEHNVLYSVSLDYRYFNLDKGKLGALPGQTSSDHIQINNLYTQTVLLSLSASL